MIYDFTSNLMKFWLDIIMLAVPYEGRKNVSRVRSIALASVFYLDRSVIVGPKCWTIYQLVDLEKQKRDLLPLPLPHPQICNLPYALQ